jgi:hypothetical protein
MIEEDSFWLGCWIRDGERAYLAKFHERGVLLKSPSRGSRLPAAEFAVDLFDGPAASFHSETSKNNPGEGAPRAQIEERWNDFGD